MYFDYKVKYTFVAKGLKSSLISKSTIKILIKCLKTMQNIGSNHLLQFYWSKNSTQYHFKKRIEE